MLTCALKYIASITKIKLRCIISFKSVSFKCSTPPTPAHHDPFGGKKKKWIQTAQSLRDTELHVISLRCSEQAVPREVILFLFVRQRKRGGEDRRRRGGGGESVNLTSGPCGRTPRIKSNSAKIHIKPRQSQKCPWNAGEWWWERQESLFFHESWDEPS